MHKGWIFPQAKLVRRTSVFFLEKGKHPNLQVYKDFWVKS